MKMRKAFTLIELLMVVTIVAILAAILLQAAGAAISLARQKKTESILWRLHHLTQARQQQLQRWEMRTPTTVVNTWEMIAVDTDARFKSMPLRTRQLIAKKLLQARFFPQAQSELWDAKAYPIGSTIEGALVSNPLQQGDWRVDDDLKMIDGWGNPIVFFRWPTALFRAHPELSPAQYSRDPNDPLCDLAGLWNAGDVFSPVITVQMPEPCRVSLMVFVSAGPDGQLGMSYPLGDVTDEQAFSDNILSINVR
jgi:prepilin-type N-terminal cleavage/methylation domain-containing protein